MNGPEHYRKAQRLLAALDVVGNPSPAQVLQVQIAQAHATLALAAATALADKSSAERDAWLNTAAIKEDSR